MGREWASPSGNFYGSTLVKLRPGDPPASTLAFVAAVAVHTALATVIDPAQLMIKWPNDLLFGGAKISGVLLERSGETVVIGVGINVRHAPALPARAVTSIHAAGGRVAIHDLTLALRAGFEERLAEWRLQGFSSATRAAWRERAHPRGTPLTIAMPDGETLSGTFAGLDDVGALRLELSDHSMRVIHAGDVFLV